MFWEIVTEISLFHVKADIVKHSEFPKTQTEYYLYSYKFNIVYFQLQKINGN